MALSPGCSFCTGCGWNCYKQSACNVRHTLFHETPIRAESFRLLVVGVRCTITRTFSCSSMFCLRARRLKLEHWEEYRNHAMYWTPCKIIYDPEICAKETVDGILQEQQWHCHRRSHKKTLYQHFGHLWRCAAFCTTLQQCHYQQSQQPTDASQRYICFRQWRSTAGGKGNTGRLSQTTTAYSQMSRLQDFPLTTRIAMYFQHDEATSNYARHVIQHLNDTFPNRWIGCGSTINWPPRSPVLTPLDFCLLALMKSEVYRNKVDTRDEMLVNILDVFAWITKVKTHSHEQHAMSSHELQNTLMLTVKLSNIQVKLYQPCHLNNKYRY